MNPFLRGAEANIPPARGPLPGSTNGNQLPGPVPGPSNQAGLLSDIPLVPITAALLVELRLSCSVLIREYHIYHMQAPATLHIGIDTSGNKLFCVTFWHCLIDSLSSTLVQGEYSDASTAAAAAREYYLQAKLASEAAERYAQGTKRMLYARIEYVSGCST